jgi:hypothetical protein
MVCGGDSYTASDEEIEGGVRSAVEQQMIEILEILNLTGAAPMASIALL